MPQQGSVTLTATFVPGARATFLTDPPGLKLLVDGRDNWPSYNFTWAAGSIHTVTAPDSQADLAGIRQYTFKSWSNGGAGTQTITFPASGLRMTASYTSFGIVIVDSTPQGVLMAVDGADCATPCNLQRPLGSLVRVTAPAAVLLASDTRIHFTGWLDSPQAARTLTVTAAPQLLRAPYAYSYLLTVRTNPAQSGTFQMTPPSPDGFYPAGATVQVMTTALDGFKFKSWGGDASGFYRPAWIDMSVPRLVLAQFDPVPFVADGGVVNAAGNTPLKSVAPGSIASIYGANLAPGIAAGPDTPLPRALNGVTVTSGGKTLPLLFVSPGQINVQVPSDALPGDQTLIISWNDQEVAAGFSVAPNAPGLFYSLTGDTPLVVAYHEDGSMVTTASPARRGEAVTVLGTGFGLSEKPLPDGVATPASGSFGLVAPVQMQAGGTTLLPEWAGAATGRVGVSAIRFRITSDLPRAVTVPLIARSNGVESNIVLLPLE